MIDTHVHALAQVQRSVGYVNLANSGVLRTGD